MRFCGLSGVDAAARQIVHLVVTIARDEAIR
jgi:hypothetical protein